MKLYRHLSTAAIAVFFGLGLHAQATVSPDTATSPATGTAPPSAAVATAGGEAVEVLTPFEVSASSDRGYVAGNEISATRIATSINNLPFSITAFTPQFIADTGATTLEDIATQAAGVKSAVNATTQGNAVFSIRGFVQAPQRNGFAASQLTSNYVDASVIERVEVVKGPASLLYGAISPGGTINYITKTAMDKPFDELHLFLGSYNYMGSTLDVNQPLIPGKLLFRLVASYQTAEEYSQNEKGRTAVVYPTFKWLITPNITLSADYQSYQLRQNPPSVYLPNTDLASPASVVNALYGAGHPAAGNLLANKTGPGVAAGVSDVSDPGFFPFYPGMPNNFNISDINDTKINNLRAFNAELFVRYNNNWSSRIHFERNQDFGVFNQSGHSTLFIPPPNSLVYTGGVWSVAPAWAAMTPAQQVAAGLAFANQAVKNTTLLQTADTQNGTPSPALIDRAPRVQENSDRGSTYQAETVGVYNWPSFSLQILGGVFYDNVTADIRTTQNRGNAASPYFRGWDVDPASPSYYVNQNEGTFTGNNLSIVNAWTTTTNSDEAAYGLLNLTMFQNRLFFVGGARYNVSMSHVFDHVAGSFSPGLRAHYTTPQFGLGFKITKDLMLYASYSESYTLSTQPFLAVAGTVIGIPSAIPAGSTAPTIGKGYETGLKATLLDNKLTGTVSVYQIEEDNVLTSGNQNINGFGIVTYSQGAKQRGRGVEGSLDWAVMPNWQIVLNASEEDVRNVAEPFGFAYYLGQTVGYTAKTTGNFWTRYDFPGALKGIWIGGGVDYTGKSAGDPRNVNYFLPAFTLYNSALGYDWNMNKVKMSATLNFKNMGNTFYKPTPNEMGEPRRFLVSLTVHY